MNIRRLNGLRKNIEIDYLTLSGIKFCGYKITIFVQKSIIFERGLRSFPQISAVRKFISYEIPVR